MEMKTLKNLEKNKMVLVQLLLTAMRVVVRTGFLRHLLAIRLLRQRTGMIYLNILNEKGQIRCKKLERTESRKVR